MPDETAHGPAEIPDGGGHPPGSPGEPAPLQGRAQFLENWDWASVTQITAGLCERGRTQRGVNSETHAAVAPEWEQKRTAELTLLETFQFLPSCHRRTPFLFFNGNTFAEIGRARATALFADLPFQRRREAASAVAHFITGVLDEGLMVEAVEGLAQAADLKPGDRVKTLQGSTNGVIVRVLEDGMAWAVSLPLEAGYATASDFKSNARPLPPNEAVPEGFELVRLLRPLNTSGCSAHFGLGLLVPAAPPSVVSD